MLIHREALELANLAPDEDDDKSRFALSCLQITGDGHVAVCDGLMFLRVSGKVMEPSLLDAMLDEDDREQEPETPILLSGDAARSFNAALKKRRVKKGQPKPHVMIAQHGKEIRVGSSDGKVTRKFTVEPPEVPYPDLNKLMVPRTIVKSVTVGIDVLMPILRTVKAVGCSSITLDFAEGEHAAIRVSAYSLDVGHVEGIFMPRKDERSDEEKAPKPRVTKPATKEEQPTLREDVNDDLKGAIDTLKNPAPGVTLESHGFRKKDEPANRTLKTHASRDRRKRRDPEAERQAQHHDGKKRSRSNVVDLKTHAKKTAKKRR